MPVSNTCLSFVPNSRVAHRLIDSGVSRMTRLPTAITGAAAGRTATATSSPTATVTPAASRPTAAPAARSARFTRPYSTIPRALDPYVSRTLLVELSVLDPVQEREPLRLRVAQDGPTGILGVANSHASLDRRYLYA